MIAENYDKFANNVINGITETLNNTCIGKEIVNDLLKLKLAENPQMTSAEWSKTKSEFLVFLFHELMNNNADLRSEFAAHLRTELLKN